MIKLGNDIPPLTVQEWLDDLLAPFSKKRAARRQARLDSALYQKRRLQQRIGHFRCTWKCLFNCPVGGRLNFSGVAPPPVPAAAEDLSVEAREPQALPGPGLSQNRQKPPGDSDV